MEEKVGMTIKQKKDEFKALIISPRKLITFLLVLMSMQSWVCTHTHTYTHTLILTGCIFLSTIL